MNDISYIAGWNMPGYLPESDPYVLESFEQAKQALEFVLRDWGNNAEKLSEENEISLAIDTIDGWRAPRLWGDPSVHETHAVGYLLWIVAAREERSDH